jgi:hypothetical protein
MDVLLPLVGMLLLFVVVFAGIGGIVFLGVRSRKRTFERGVIARQVVANQMGWQFSRDIAWASIPYANYFQLFTQGIGRRVYDVIHGEAEGVGITIFNYQFAAKATVAQTVHAQTVAMFQSNSISLPAFLLRPSSIKHQLGAAFSASISFPTHADFSSQYLLSGSDEIALRSLFSDSALAFFAGQPGWSLEGGGSQLFLYRESQILTPQYTPTLVNEGLRVLSVLRGVQAPAERLK